VADATGLAISNPRLGASRRRCARSWTWPGPSLTERRLQVVQALLTGIEIAAAVSALVTVVFVVVVRYFWRRGKTLREP
jgi:hypothetical protein